MKRSEMVQRMTEYWLGLFPGEDIVTMNVDEDTFREVKNRMDMLLFLLENRGMVPPVSMRYEEKPPGNTLCSEVCEWDVE